MMLTKKQYELLLFIEKYIRAKGIAPSYEEMREGVQKKSKAEIHSLIKKLQERGVIRQLPFKARAIEILKSPNLFEAAALMAAEEGANVCVQEDRAEETSVDIVSVPFYGSISLSFSLECFRSPPQQTLKIPTFLLKNHEGEAEYVAFVVKGDFLKDAAILDGDLLCLRMTDLVGEESLVFSVLDGHEGHVKRYNVSEEKVTLTAANKYMMPQTFDKSRVTPRGYVAAVMRSGSH
jgi:repressor LexA